VAVNIVRQTTARAIVNPHHVGAHVGDDGGFLCRELGAGLHGGVGECVGEGVAQRRGARPWLSADEEVAEGRAVDPVEFGGGDEGGRVDDAGPTLGEPGDPQPGAEDADVVADVDAELVGGDVIDDRFAVSRGVAGDEMVRTAGLAGCVADDVGQLVAAGVCADDTADESNRCNPLDPVDCAGRGGEAGRERRVGHVHRADTALGDDDICWAGPDVCGHLTHRTGEDALEDE
jgi:hypothetical protein